MDRAEVYKAINTERDFQEDNKGKEDSHIVEDFPLSAALEAIRYNIDEANANWYIEKAPYNDAIRYIRKIAAICVQMGEKYDMLERK